MELILAAGIGATATIAGAYMTTRPTNKPKRPVPRKERKRRQVWLAITSVLVAAALVLAALPTGLVNGSSPIWAIAPLTALLLSYGVPIRVRWALPATLAMLVATTAAPPALIARTAPVARTLSGHRVHRHDRRDRAGDARPRRDDQQAPLHLIIRSRQRSAPAHRQSHRPRARRSR